MHLGQRAVGQKKKDSNTIPMKSAQFDLRAFFGSLDGKRSNSLGFREKGKEHRTWKQLRPFVLYLPYLPCDYGNCYLFLADVILGTHLVLDIKSS